MDLHLKKQITVLLSLIICICIIFCGCTNRQQSSSIQIYSSTGEYVLIESFSPCASASFMGGSVIVVSVKSNFNNISVTAEFDNETIPLYLSNNEEEPLNNYLGSFTLKNVNKDTVLGQIKITCTKDKTTETYYSGIITVLKGNGDESIKYIAEVVDVPAETFNGDTVDDTSRPYNSYLPVGTVDYCSTASIINEDNKKSYRLLGFGKRVYDNQNLKIYEGTLPSENRMSVDRVDSEGKYTVLSFYTDFKAPFTVELKDQEYKDTDKGVFVTENPTFSYVEIRLMYCTEIIGDITFKKDNPLFKDSQISYEENCAVLKLNLKKEGRFYGWRAEYDESDCLVLRFLEPTRLYNESNKYDYGLYDKVIVVDAGHGGKDSGSAIEGLYESYSNLSFAFILKEELEAAGATVYLTRKDDTFMDTYDRYRKVLEYEPDFLISVHRNGGGGNGFGSYYYNSFSAPASKFVYESTAKTQLYRKCSGSSWHYFFLNRLGICPSVLTENGFLDDEEDRINMRDSDHQKACAQAIVSGVIEYFKYQNS